MFCSKSQHGEEAFPPGVPAPRLSIVAATQALPNCIGQLEEQNGIGIGNDQIDPNEPMAKKLKMENEIGDHDDDRLVIEEIEW